jgi:dienelactone hydrolase
MLARSLAQLSRRAAPALVPAAIIAACATVALFAGGSAGVRATARRAAGVAHRISAPVEIAEQVVTFTDRHRTIRLPDGAVVPRRVVTVIRYPLHVDGPLPLIVFGHGFAVTPAPYAPLLRTWAAAGFVVAAPIFPLGNAHAPGGPDEADIVNQPGDMSLVITRLETGPLGGLIDRHAIAVAGQSDGGMTALATAYDPPYLDTRVDAAVILSGAELPGRSIAFHTPSPPLLATQGTADTTNLPRNTYAFFAAAPRPEYLLQLLGAGHLAPYASEQPQLGIIERTTLAFLDRYLKHEPGAGAQLVRAGDVPGVAVLTADP